MKRKRVPATMTCPCCEERRLADAYAAPLRQERELAERAGALARGEEGWTVALAQRRLLVWACDDCLRCRRAKRNRVAASGAGEG